MTKGLEVQKKRLRKNIITVLELFGDGLIASGSGYKGLINVDAVDLYIVKKYGWFPKDVRKISIEDKYFLLNEELSTYKKKR